MQSRQCSRLGKSLFLWNRPRGRDVNVPNFCHGNCRLQHTSRATLQPTSGQKADEKAQLPRPDPQAFPGARRIRIDDHFPQMNTFPFSPAIALGVFLQLKDGEKEKYWLAIRKRFSLSTLPAITLHYLATSSVENASTALASIDQGGATLASRGMSWNDVSRWAWILSGDTPNEMAHRLVSSPPGQPMFILLEILRRDITKVKTLNLLLNYAWDRVMNFAGPISPKMGPDTTKDNSGHGSSDVATCSETEDSVTATEPVHNVSFQEASKNAHGSFPMQENEFSILISRLLKQCRRLWPSAMGSVSYMTAPFFKSISERNNGGIASLDPRTFTRLSTLNNYFLRLLALPSSIEPLKNIVHNWSAQKVLLELAGKFDPPLMLDQGSYTAIVQVLSAMQKSERESRSAAFRSTSWPPWRVDQDGMDAQRPRDEDLSRTVLALIHSKESGYSPDLHAEVMSIFGGLDLDGTPTIHTRKLLKWRGGSSDIPSSNKNLNPALWAARIEATREVWEAWGAFREFNKNGGVPNMSMYFAMFQKVESESRRLEAVVRQNPTPGDGREVIAVSDDNFTSFHKMYSRPPTLQQLYLDMKNSGIRPSGRCLSFLLRHTRTIDQGLHYLFDSGIDMRLIAYLVGGDRSQVPDDVLAQIPDRLLADFIGLICRFAPRVPTKAASYGDFRIIRPFQSVQVFSLIQESIQQSRVGSGHVTSHVTSRLQHPLRHSAYLLRQRKPSFRPAWYQLFESLALSNLVLVSGDVIPHDIATNPSRLWNNHMLAWRIAMAALREFFGCHLELDPRGFYFLCLNFAKFAGAAFHNPGLARARISIIDQSQILRDEFAKLTEKCEPLPRASPTFLHSLHGVQLHIYVRCMGLVDDHATIVSTIEWMVENCRELDAIASRSRNGRKMLRKTLIASRIFCSGTEHEVALKRLVEQVESWGGWPAEEELVEYMSKDEIVYFDPEREGLEADDEEPNGSEDESIMTDGIENGDGDLEAAG